MPFLLKNTIHRSLAESVYNEILSRRSNYYYFIGKVLDWNNVNSPDTPDVTQGYEYRTRSEILSVKKINVNDVSLVVPRIDWVPGTIYDIYDPDYSAGNAAQSGATDLKNATFYVLTSTFNVYKCLFNNNNGQSTIEPFGTDITPITYNDGYVWKYLYTIPLSNRNKFLTSEYMPVQRAVNNAYYSNGKIRSIIVDSYGSGYLGNANVTLTVQGSFLGKPGNVTANLTPVLSNSGSFLSVIIDNPGNNYSNASIVISNNLYGNSLYKGVSNVKVYYPGTGYTSAARNNTTVKLITTGTQPNANAVLSLVFNNLSNSLIGVDVLNPGNGYTPVIINNSVVEISTSGAVQPTSNATANAYYSGGAVLTPVVFDGKIVDVVISDPGINYQANNRTFITTIGDGTGVQLQPVVNKAGQVVDVIILNPGEGYSYLDIEIVGDGTGANAYAQLSTGDLTTLQSIVELSAIDGGLHSIKVIDSGSNYTYANVFVYGDGSGFVGNVLLLNNTVSAISVINPGTGYSYANAIISGSGTGANISAIISPLNGHGSDVVSELFADRLMIYSTIDNEKNHGLMVDNDYRQIGIIKDIKKYESDEIFIDATGSACYLFTLNSVAGLSADTQLVLTDENNQSKIFEVIKVDTTYNKVLINNKNNYPVETGNVLTSPSLTNYSINSINKVPNINKLSGDLFYIDNRVAVSYSDKQLVKLRTVIQF